LNFLCFYCAER